MVRTTHPTTPMRETAGDRFLRRWLSLGGLLTAIGLGNLVAALNWNAISRGSEDFRAVAAMDRYAIWGFLFLVLGGVAYTVGVIFYRNKEKRFWHGIWHFFVLAGTVLHFFAVYTNCCF